MRQLLAILLPCCLAFAASLTAAAAAQDTPDTTADQPSPEEKAAAAILNGHVLPAMVQFQCGDYVDQCENGIGQYGLFPELSGKIPVHGSTLSLIEPTFDRTEPVVGGYHFKIYLPASPTSAMTSNADGSRPPLDKSKDEEAILLQSQKWLCYAWPESGTGRELVINQFGNVYARPYHGTPPAWNDFLSNSSWKDPAPPVGWTPVRHKQATTSSKP